MSHELRTPLNAMLGFAQLLELDRRHPLSADQQPWVAQIQQAGWHLLDMINDVLDLSRIESGNLKLQIEPIGLPDLLSASLAMVDTEAKRRGLAISTDLADGTGVLMGDATRVKQILVNLLSNAVKYNNSEGGRIHVASRMRPHDMVEIAVTDTGLGMTAEQLAELFQPFNRLGRERSSQEGTGIGLVISQRGRADGRLAARAQHRRRGLVLHPDPARRDRARHRALRPRPAGDGQRRVPPAHRALRRGQRDQRRGDARHPLAAAAGADGGLGQRRRGAAHDPRAPARPDPARHAPADMSGLELLEQLKSDEATADVPVVVVSADATARQIEARDGGRRAPLTLTKPVSVAELLAAVDEVLESLSTRFG